MNVFLCSIFFTLNLIFVEVSSYGLVRNTAQLLELAMLLPKINTSSIKAEAPWQHQCPSTWISKHQSPPNRVLVPSFQPKSSQFPQGQM